MRKVLNGTVCPVTLDLNGFMQNITSSLYGAEQDLSGGVAVMLLDIAIMSFLFISFVAYFYPSAANGNVGTGDFCRLVSTYSRPVCGRASR